MSRLRPLTLMCLMFTLATPAVATETRTGARPTVGVDEVVEDDMYVTGDEIVIAGVVRGDVYAAARRVTVLGRVEGDLVAAAQAVRIEGTVTDDVRVASQTFWLTPGARVGDSVTAAAYSVWLGEGSYVEDEVLAAAARHRLEGRSGAADLVGAAVEVRGEVNGPLTVRAQYDPATPLMAPPALDPIPSAAPGLTVGQRAIISGPITFAGPVAPILEAGSRSGALAYTALPPEDWRGGVGWAIGLRDFVSRLVSLLLVGLLGIWLAPRGMQRLQSELGRRPMTSLGAGAVGIFGLGLATVGVIALTFVTTLAGGLVSSGGLVPLTLSLGALALSALSLFGVLVVGLLAPVVTASRVGGWLLERAGAHLAHPFWSTLLGITVYAALASVPVVGWLLSAAAVLFGLGAVGLSLLVPSHPRMRPVSRLPPESSPVPGSPVWVPTAAGSAASP